MLLATDPEALTQLARLLGVESLRDSSAEAVQAGFDARFTHLVHALVDEAAASDDVIDCESAMAYIEGRLRFLGPLLTEEQQSRLYEALREKIEAW